MVQIFLKSILNKIDLCITPSDEKEDVIWLLARVCSSPDPTVPKPTRRGGRWGRNTTTRFGCVQSWSRLEGITKTWGQAGDGADG